MSETIASRDVVRTHSEATGMEFEPLVVIEPLEQFLDEAGLGRGAPLEVSPLFRDWLLQALA